MIALRVDHFDGVPVARMPSDVDVANASALAERLTASLPRQGLELIVDLTGTRYLDSAGVDMLFRLNQRLCQRRARMHLVIAPGSSLRRLAEIVALPEAVPVHRDLAAALAAASN